MNTPEGVRARARTIDMPPARWLAFKAIARRVLLPLVILASMPVGARAAEVSYRYAELPGGKIFYREAGDPAKPTLLLLHGFPSSSHQFRDVIPVLAPYFHVIAPDLPGMGHSDAPAAGVSVTFPLIAERVEAFVESLGQKHLVIYMTDFGTPVGMKMALRHPDWIDGLVFQNGVISLDGLSPARLKEGQGPVGPITDEQRRAAEGVVSLKTALYLYRTGAKDPDGLSPDSWTDDAAGLANDDNRRVMVDLTLDARNNRRSYPDYQAYLADKRPKTLVIWGKNDPLFGPAGAQAIGGLVPGSRVSLYDTGHFALEEYGAEIAMEIIEVFAKH